MEWVLRSPEIHRTFSYLGFKRADRYHVNENCNAALETILHNILTEDKYVRAYRRSINFGQNIKKDLIPLLIHAKDDKTIELLVIILVNLTIPIECLLSVEVTSQTDFGLNTIFEINQLLTSAKAAFTGAQATKVVVDFLKKNADPDQPKVSPEQCTNISNCLLLLRNILHIPEDAKCPCRGANNRPAHSMQNLIMWNMFSQNIDKVLIKLIIIPEATNWAVTIVQLIALLYKDQHVVTLHQLLKIWLESCNSESSEDNESNTSPPYRDCEDSSSILTSYSSDTGARGKSNHEPNSENNGCRVSSENTTMKDANQPHQSPSPDENNIHMRGQDAPTRDENIKSDNDDNVTSECGYRTQIKDQELISTSSNDDEAPSKNHVHLRPHKPKRRVNTRARIAVTLQDRKRNNLIKRGKANIVNVRGLQNQTPTDKDISHILKEFTIDFLLKGYNSLVKTLHTQVLTNRSLEIDTSHFFWLITYFLKFATQIELDLQNTSAVLSFDIVSYLTAEGVNLCEQFEMDVKLDENYLIPSSRRLHLVVTAIREFVETIEVYKKFPHICAEDKDALLTLQNKMCETDELRSLLVLLLRRYNSKYHIKQYLQDLIVTNHILLTFVDGAMRTPGYTGSANMTDHIKQFAAPEIMCQYGLLLEEYAVNGEYINDCVFTIMHHVAGELDSLTSLYQPKILKTFTSIWQSGFEICDDWSDLVHYVINSFSKNPHKLQETQVFDVDMFLADRPAVITLAKENTQLAREAEKMVTLAKEGTQLAPEAEKMVTLAKEGTQLAPEAEKKLPAHNSGSQSSKERWTEDELSALSWIYLQCKTLPNVVGEVLKYLKEKGIVKSGDSFINELYKRNIIDKGEYEKLSKAEIRDVEIRTLCEQLRQAGKTKYIDWVQQVLLDTCYAKLQFEKRYRNECFTSGDESDILQFKLFNQEYNSPVMSPVSYHALQLNQPVPLVPWNCEQAAMCKNTYFLKLLHQLGFLMPVDTGKVFTRIPHFWSADVLYEKASKIAVIDTTKLKFSLSDITSCSTKSSWQQCNSALPTDLAKDVRSLITTPENLCQGQLAAIERRLNFKSRSDCSLTSDIQHEANKRCWLEVVRQSQNLKLTCKATVSVPEDDAVPAEVAGAPAPAQAGPREHTPAKDVIAHLSQLEDSDSDNETASIASDITHMHVSDEEEKLELALRQSVTKPIKDESSSDTEGGPGKRIKVSESF